MKGTAFTFWRKISCGSVIFTAQRNEGKIAPQFPCEQEGMLQDQLLPHGDGNNPTRVAAVGGNWTGFCFIQG